MNIESFRELAREQGVDLNINGLYCLPRNIKKYNGCIYRHQRKGGDVCYCVHIRHRDFKRFASFNNEAEAEQYIRDVNMRESLPIRNKYTVFDNHLEVELARGRIMICDIEDLYFVENHNWHSSDGYAISKLDGSHYFFHNAVMKHLPCEITVGHINLDKLDNRKTNLRLVDKRTQAINRGVQVSNKSGVVGVSYNKRIGAWTATWKDIDSNQCSKSFACKKYGYDEARAMAVEH